MPRFMARELENIAAALFDAAGSPHAESAWVAETLVRSNLVGHDSHGIVRVAPYLSLIESGNIKPGAPITVEHETPVTAVVDGKRGWGQVAARFAMELAIEKARVSGVGVVAVRNCQHAGRIGEYPTMAATQGMIGYVVVNSYGGGQSVAPWGGIDRRFTPNPIAFAAPSGHDWPLLMDITASTLPEGKVRVALHRGEKLPDGMAIDYDGQPLIDPAAFYADPPGALLPLGGLVGHKGYGLLVMTEVLAGILTEAGHSGEQMPNSGNGLLMQAIQIEAFTPLPRFTERVRALRDYVKSSRRMPGVDEILFPGEPEYRTMRQRLRDGIVLEESIWAEIEAKAQALGVSLAPG